MTTMAAAGKMHQAVEKAHKKTSPKMGQVATEKEVIIKKYITKEEEEEELKLVSYYISKVLTTDDDDDVISCLLAYNNYISVFRNSTKTAIIYNLLLNDISYINYLSKLLYKPTGQLSKVLGSLINMGIIHISDDMERIRSFRMFISDRMQFGHRGVGEYHIDNMKFYELTPEARKVYSVLEKDISKRLNPIIVTAIHSYKKAWLKTHEQVQASIKETRKTDKVAEARIKSADIKKQIVRETINKSLSFSEFVKLVEQHKENEPNEMKAELDKLIMSISTWKETREWKNFNKVWGNYAK